MTLVRYKTTNDLFPRSFSNIFDGFFNESDFKGGSKAIGFLPKTDIIETEKDYEINAALPGLAKEAINVDVKDGQLIINGERKSEKETKEKKFHSVETQYGSFTRSFWLPEDADADNIEAEYKNGILAVVIPKSEKAQLKKGIKIK